LDSRDVVRKISSPEQCTKGGALPNRIPWAELASRTFPIVRRHSLLHSIEQRPSLLHGQAAGGQDHRCELQRVSSAANAQHVSNGHAVHPVQLADECQRRILKLQWAEVAMLKVHTQVPGKEMVGRHKFISQPPGVGHVAPGEHSVVEPGARVDAQNAEVVQGARNLFQVALGARKPFRRVVRKTHHEEGAHLDPLFVCLVDGLRERLAHVVELAHGEAVVIVYGLNPDRHAKAAGGRHLLHERAVTELIESHHGDEAPFLPAQQGEHLGAVIPIRKEVVVRELQEGFGVEILQLVDLPFEHVQRLGA